MGLVLSKVEFKDHYSGYEKSTWREKRTDAWTENEPN